MGVSLFAQNKLTGYEYWFDNDYSAKTSAQITPATTYQWQTNIPCEQLSAGIHTFNSRFKDQSGQYTTTLSQWFQKLPEMSQGNQIVLYEYWTDNDYQQRVVQNVTPSNNYTLATSIDFNVLPEGIHVFNIRCKDSSGKWSTTVSQWFQKLAPVVPKNLVAYEYWVNDNYDKKYSGVITGEQSYLLLDELDASTATKATNYIHFRFKDDAEQWSAVLTSDFYRPVEPEFTHIAGLSEVTFTNTSKYADKYEWDFGDGNTSTQVNPVHAYAEPGAYQVKLIVQNKEFTDSIFHYVEIEGIRAISSNKGGNGGVATVIFYGGGLTDNTQVKLQSENDPIEGGNIKLIKPGELEVEFNLIDKSIGIYDILIKDESTFGNITLPQGYQVEETRKPEVWAELIGRDVVIDNRWQTYTIKYGNRGNIDALFVPIIIGVTKTMEESITDIEFVDFMVDTIQVASEDNFELLSHIPIAYSCDTLLHHPFKGIFYPLYIPTIPGNYQGEVSFRLKTNKTITCVVWIDEPLYEYDLVDVTRMKKNRDLGTNIIPSSDLQDCVALAMEHSLTETGLGYIPVIGCFSSGLIRMLELLDRPIYWIFDEKPVQQWGSFAWSCGYTAISCIGTLFELTPISYAIGAGINTWAGAHTLELAIDDCYKAYPPSDINIRPQSSFDPNEIVGPSGYSEQNFIQKRSHLNYTLYFENDAEKATAPAQEIFLTDTLDITKFNPEDFSFGTFTFRDITVEAIPGVTEFSKDIDMRERGENIIIRISATFDKETGIINWHLIALDPETMDLTESPYLGILYPNTEPPVGEGNVTYRIGVKENLPDGTVIENQAHITFDLNEAIATNVYKNTFDYAKPESRMSAAYEIVNDSSVVVSWSGSDTGSSIRSYTVHVSKNDGEYFSWLFNTTETSATFIGTSNHNYKFYAVATDNVGNEENKNEIAELAIDLVTSIKNPEKGKSILVVNPNPVDNLATITLDLDKASDVRLVLYNITGQSVLNIYDQYTLPGKRDILLNTSNLNQGVYMLEMKTQDNRIVERILVK
ncbi:hypothetical protein FACS189440_20340 [Bacteroidia bacterium]|nr:hypothetical protein FACS189440_20340 [Bacteroidia bacterium]